MADINDVGNFISSLDTQAAAWYRGITTNTPVVVPGTAASLTAQQIAINQAAQAQLSQTNPTLAGILANPQFIVIVLLVIAAIVLVVLIK